MLPKILDIAKQANTSKSTVSRYLNGGKVKESTAKAIDQAVKGLNYHPNINARRLVTSKTNVIGVVLDDISNIYYSQVLSGIQKTASERGFVCTFHSRAFNQKTEADYLELFYSGQIDGLILGTFQVRENKTIQTLADSGFPIVLIGDSVGNKTVNSIDIDNKQGTIIQVNYLYELGHRSIAYLRGPSHLSSANFRAEGFLKGMRLLSLDTELIMDSVWTVEGGFEATQKLLSYGKKFTALLCSNEYSAFGAMEALKAAGIQIPGQVCVGAFDDGILTQVAQPSLTTIRQPFKTLGETALKQLLDCISNPEAPTSSILIQPDLIKRSSTTRKGDDYE